MHGVLRARRKKVMKTGETNSNDKMRKEYDFSKGVRGKFGKRYKEGTNIVLLEPDVAKVFKTSSSVNKALRAMAEVIKTQK